MRTLIIYNPIISDMEYYIYDEDMTRFDNLLVNAADSDFELVQEFCDLLWDAEGNRLENKCTDKSLLENKEWDRGAIVTELP